MHPSQLEAPFHHRPHNAPLTPDDVLPGLTFSPAVCQRIFDKADRQAGYNPPAVATALHDMVNHPISILGRLFRMTADYAKKDV